MEGGSILQMSVHVCASSTKQQEQLTEYNYVNIKQIFRKHTFSFSVQVQINFIPIEEKK